MQVRLEALNLDYGGPAVIDDLNLVIHQGETVVLLGRSGCGKTSTMRSIAGLEEPTSGRILIGDDVVFDAAHGKNVPAHRRNVGMVFQSYAVWPHRTVLENVSFPLKVRQLGREDVRRKAMSVLETVGLAHLADRSASALSGGQMQRVALARSLAMEPSVLLLDEPLSNLDAILRDNLRVELRRIQQESGLTSLYVTHDQTEALALADRVAVMEAGRITQLAPPMEVYRRPASASIATFLGVSNVFPVRPGQGSSARLVDHPLDIAFDGPVLAGKSSVCFRPEAVHLLPPSPAAQAGPNVWDGTIRVAVYQGRTIRYQVLLREGSVIDAVVDAADGRLEAIGTPVRVHVSPAEVLLLPDGVGETPAGENA